MWKKRFPPRETTWGNGALYGITCYQSRVGPLEWIGPYTDDEIKRAGQEKSPLIVVPIAFVSEHWKLVELDMEYKELAEESGVPFYGVFQPWGIIQYFWRD